MSQVTFTPDELRKAGQAVDKAAQQLKKEGFLNVGNEYQTLAFKLMAAAIDIEKGETE